MSSTSCQPLPFVPNLNNLSLDSLDQTPPPFYTELFQYFSSVHHPILAEIGVRLARVVDRALWKDKALPPLGEPINQEQGLKIQATAFSKVVATMKHLPEDQQKQFRLFSPYYISTVPKLFGQLLIADKVNLAYILWTQLPLLTRSVFPLEAFSLLAARTTLSLDNKNLQTLPEAFGDFVSLAELNLAHNKLYILPESFGNLILLIFLDLSSNLLTFLPETFRHLAKLEVLNLNANHLSSLPPWFEELHSLTKLYLVGNQFSSIPLSFCKLTGLRELHLGYNQLQSLPGWLGALNKLTELHLTGNQLSSLPPSIGKCIELVSLGLSGNRLQTLPKTLINLTKLKLLDLRDNKLIIEPQLCSMLAQMRQRGCEILCDPEVEKEIAVISKKQEELPKVAPIIILPPRTQ